MGQMGHALWRVTLDKFHLVGFLRNIFVPFEATWYWHVKKFTRCSDVEQRDHHSWDTHFLFYFYFFFTHLRSWSFGCLLKKMWPNIQDSNVFQLPTAPVTRFQGELCGNEHTLSHMINPCSSHDRLKFAQATSPCAAGFRKVSLNSAP